ncbi:MAG: helix-turn-helix transcriptional regulator [Cyanobacteria bacterium]|nr:helix-turn-helix transcriptional regulator [Cyanobacteriota bacterium]
MHRQPTPTSHPSDLTHDASRQLKQWMRQAGIRSWRTLAEAADLSLYQIRQLRAGDIERMRLGTIDRVARVLQVSPVSLISAVTADRATGGTGDLVQLQQEYERLKAQMASDRETMALRWQQEALATLEPWLLGCYTAADAARQNPQMPARTLLHLMQPLDRLLHTWDVEQIAPIGEELAYDPQWHTLTKGHAEPGDRVRVTMPGFRHRRKLLHRAHVVPIT